MTPALVDSLDSQAVFPRQAMDDSRKELVWQEVEFRARLFAGEGAHLVMWL